MRGTGIVNSRAAVCGLSPWSLCCRQADELGLIGGQPTVYLFHFPLEESVVCPGADLSSSSASNVN
jgi:hypothetical protein